MKHSCTYDAWFHFAKAGVSSSPASAPDACTHCIHLVGGRHRLIVVCVQVKICDADEVDILDKRGYLTICISLPKDGKIYLRKTDGIREWHKLLKVLLASPAKVI